jgi:hypothetical protein
VPFDFDGERLMWMQYVTADERDLFIYEFESKSIAKALNFGRRDGLISHCKMLGRSLFYVKNTNTVIVSTFLKVSNNFV